MERRKESLLCSLQIHIDKKQITLISTSFKLQNQRKFTLKLINNRNIKMNKMLITYIKSNLYDISVDVITVSNT